MPNPSLEARPNGMPPGPVWRYAYIFASPGLASCRWSRLSSNVRPHKKHSRMPTGSCLCRSVRYTVASEISHVENCHCSMCRKAHGAAFSTNALVSTSALTIEGSEHLSSYRSSPNREKLFCSRCGSQLFIKRLNALEGTVITLGTLDDDPKISPSRHVFIGSKAPWYDPEAHLPTYQVYPGFEPNE